MAEMTARPNVTGSDNLSESVEELKMKLEAMKRIIDNEQEDEEKGCLRRNRKCKDSIIDGSFLSFVFIIVLILILCVTFYAFSNLYYAVLKKFPARKHSEL